MDRVQLADTPQGRGCQTMLGTDATYGMTPRRSALGDLRFAGTIATGLVAGTLGLGALAAPLVGWRDWPSRLRQDETTTGHLAKPEARMAARPAQTPGRAGAVPGTAAQAPGGASALTTLGL